MIKPPPAVQLGVRDEEYVLGASPIPFESRNTTRDWGQFRSAREIQRTNKFDPWDCTNHTATNQWEWNANWALKNGLWSLPALKFWRENGYIVNEKFEISERHNAKASGTRPGKGNFMYAGHDVLRNIGVVPESMWPTNIDMDEAEFFKEFTPEVNEIAKKSLEYYTWLHQFLTGASVRELDKALEMAPLGLAVACCDGWNKTDINVCNDPPIHAVTNDNIDFYFAYDIFDSYDPVEKKLAPGYQVYSVVQGILYPKAEPTQFIFNRNLSQGERSEDVRQLQIRLGVEATGFYGDLTKKAVWTFQQKNGLDRWWDYIFFRGNRVLKETRDVLNKK